MAGRSASSAIGEVNQLRRRVKKIQRLIEDGPMSLSNPPETVELLNGIYDVAKGRRDEELFIEAQDARAK